MRLCKKCGNIVPVRCIIDDRERNLQNRKFCLECSPFNSHNTKDISKWGEKRSTRGEAVTKYRQKIKRKLVEYKGGQCIECGYNKPIFKVYEFHHRNPSEKKFPISLNLTKSYSDLIAEVDKCDLLCCRCHREKG